MQSLSRRGLALAAAVVAAAVLSLTGAGPGHLSAQAPLPSAATNAHVNVAPPIRGASPLKPVHAGSMTAAHVSTAHTALPRLDPYASIKNSAAAQSYRSAAAAALPADALDGTPITVAAPSSPISAQGGPSLLPELPAAAVHSTAATNFAGIDSHDNHVANHYSDATGGTIEPPDQGLCANKDFTVELVNDSAEMFNASGTSLTGVFALAPFLSDGTFLSDPRCYYDPLEDAWFAVVLGFTFDHSNHIVESHYDIFWSISHDPTAATWFEVRLNTSNPSKNPACPCLADQPLLGVSATAIYLQGNLFNSKLTSFAQSTVWMLSKQDFLNFQPIRFWTFPSITVGSIFGTYPVASLQPAQTADPHAPGEFFLATLNFFGGTERAILTFLISNESAVDSKFDAPVASADILFGQFYAPPPCARQPNSTFCIDSGDNRMMQVQWVPNQDQASHAGDGTLWGGHNTLGRFSGSTTPQTMVATDWIHPSVTLDSHGNVVLASSTSILAQGKFGLAASNPGDSTALMYPAIAAGQNGQPFIIASGMTSTRTPVVFTATLTTTGHFTTATAPTLLSEEGGGNDQGFTCTRAPFFTCRWGDYSAAMTIFDISSSQGNPDALPTPTGVIGATETTSPNAVVNGGGTVTSNWGTLIATLQ